MRALRLAAMGIVGVACTPVACGLPARIEYARPPVLLGPTEARDAWTDAREVFENRCVVCHGCYDAPCQLKLGTFEGIERGGTEARVYDNTRLSPASPTRLEIDARDTPGWRAKDFHPVLPEGPHTDPRASLLVRMLDLKRTHPIPAATEIAASFTLDLDRGQTCTKAASFDAYAKKHPLWGMPYALPGLEPSEEAALVRWVEGGAPYTAPPPLAPQVTSAIESWESFLNAAPLKNRLASRYIYEHLFLGSIYFQGLADATYFRLVRSRTEHGVVDEIATRRPFDDPEVDRVYYRFVRRLERPLEKTHMPYPLTAGRLRRYQELFIDPEYAVERLPTYDPSVSANPFRAFQAIPAKSRYRFLLEEAEYSIMGFIKGPVCRGQVALDVIEDRFWITFMNPDLPWIEQETSFLAGEEQNLDMPAEGGSFELLSQWLRYGDKHERYITNKNAFLTKALAGAGSGVDLSLIWTGDGKVGDAALTVFRHFDSATVVKGLVGPSPKTAWLVGYPLLERIHYLLVAGYDVFGNVGHQLNTRLYMDFLRMEGEANFLLLLPSTRRSELVLLWYRGISGSAKKRIATELTMFSGEPRIPYRTPEPEAELFPMLERRIGKALSHDLDAAAVGDARVRAAMGRLSRIKGLPASFVPELSFVNIPSVASGTDVNFTLARESAHTNVSHLFHEDERRVPTEDGLSVVPGFLGAYPNALFEVPLACIEAFVDAIAALDGPTSYQALRARFGVLRSSDRFWAFSDRILADHRRESPGSGGLFDFNRLGAY